LSPEEAIFIDAKNTRQATYWTILSGAFRRDSLLRENEYHFPSALNNTELSVHRTFSKSNLSLIGNAIGGLFRKS